MRCAECDSEIVGRHSQARFCAIPCRDAWMNRRRLYGAMFYDLVMANRFDRTQARALKLTSAINRLASVCREGDVTKRGGRLSWRAPKDVLADAPWLSTQEGRV